MNVPACFPLSLALLWSVFPHAAAEAQVRLAAAGKATAVIVADDWEPTPAAAFTQISVTAGQRSALLADTFSGVNGESISSLGWKHSEGEYAVSYRGKELGYGASARARGADRYVAVADKTLVRPHTIRTNTPLILEYVLSLPADTSQESWAYVRLHTREGKRWTHGIYVSTEGQVFLSPAAEPNDPERSPLPSTAGRVLDMKMELLPTTVRWYWRNHGTGDPYQRFQHWAVSGEVTITGVRISSLNYRVNRQRASTLARRDVATVDLKKYLDAVTGGHFDVVGQGMDSPANARIFVGDSAAARALAPAVHWDDLGTDEIVIKTVGRDLILAGGQPRGTIYAIYTFLQDVVGCRWWAPGEVTVPQQPDLSVTSADINCQPAFRMRVHSSTIGSTHEGRSWLRLSYDLNFDFGTHSIPRLLPKKLFLQHPDWFMYCREDGGEDERYSYLHTLKSFQKTIATETERNDLGLIREYLEIGRRTRRIPQQPCLHSPGARAKIAENVLAELEQNYSRWKYPEKIFWITQNDGRYMCQCDQCEAVRKVEGSDSANWLLLVNEIAHRLEGRYPDVLFGMFAYLHTERPPRTVRPRQNVLVYAPLLTANKRDPVWHYPQYAASLKRWGEIAKHFYVWDYDANFRNFYQPHPNYLAQPESMRFFQEIGVTGVMVQGAHGMAADLGPLRAWVNARMMWNPQQDPRQLVQEFTTGYYGAAGPSVLRYINLLLTAVQRDPDYWLGCYRTDTTGWLTLEDVNAAVALLEKAAEAVRGDEVRMRRVWMARRAIDFAWLDRFAELQQEAAAKGLLLRVPKPGRVVDQLVPYRGAWGQFREGPRPSQFDAYFDRLRKQFPSAEVKPKLER